MDEETYREFKEEHDPISTLSPRPPGLATRKRQTTVSRSVRLRPKPETDYASFKAAIDELKTEIRVQHEQTRAEVRNVRSDVLAAIKASPAGYVKLLCEFGSLFLLFSLAIRFALKIELINPAFAWFALAALAVYWLMAHVSQQRGQKKQTLI